MSEGEGSNEQEQQEQQHLVQDLNFSINDILSHNHDVNDSSFQSIVQTLSNNNNEQHITPSYAHLPAELQDLFSNETDDLLSPQGSNSDASILQADMSMWNQQPYMSSPLNASPASNVSTPPVASSTTLLDNITSQLPPERKERFIQLFRELQTNAVSAADFLLQAKSLLGQQQYQQLEDLKNKPSQLVQKPIRPAAEKRILSSSQIRAEDAQRSMPGIM